MVPPGALASRNVYNIQIGNVYFYSPKKYFSYHILELHGQSFVQFITFFQRDSKMSLISQREPSGYSSHKVFGLNPREPKRLKHYLSRYLHIKQERGQEQGNISTQHKVRHRHYLAPEYTLFSCMIIRKIQDPYIPKETLSERERNSCLFPLYNQKIRIFLRPSPTGYPRNSKTVARALTTLLEIRTISIFIYIV